ncbi:MAG: hypothetical protein F6K58_10840 [Symploca sp. SIO2E9]|nr:hypothetical protein [Symploca sp. SIO2E9]
MGERVSRRGDAETLQTRRIEIPTKISFTLGMGRLNAGNEFGATAPHESERLSAFKHKYLLAS